MIDHLSTYATDYERTRAFYDAVLGELGYVRTMEMQTAQDPAWPTRRLASYGPQGRHIFWLIETREAATPRHVAFVASTREAVDRFHKAALQHGGKDNGGPGMREHYHPNYYGAFVLDPDGNNVEAVIHHP
jgi:catechol 2,3-dioxygenase-like lactoylglutathione lyase family enzyme